MEYKNTNIFHSQLLILHHLKWGDGRVVNCTRGEKPGRLTAIIIKKKTLINLIAKLMGRWQSGQLHLTVNQTPHGYVGSNPTLPKFIIKHNMCK